MQSNLGLISDHSPVILTRTDTLKYSKQTEETASRATLSNWTNWKLCKNIIDDNNK